MIKQVAAALAAFGLLGASLTGASANGGKDHEDSGKITICHRTGSDSNPYVRITIDKNGLHGHGGHDGDIIPAPASGCPKAIVSPVVTTTATATATATANPCVCPTGHVKQDDSDHKVVAKQDDDDHKVIAKHDDKDQNVVLKQDDDKDEHVKAVVKDDDTHVKTIKHRIVINNCDLGAGLNTNSIDLTGKISLKLFLNGNLILAKAVDEHQIVDVTRTLNVNLIINGVDVTPQVVNSGALTAQIYVNGVLIPVNSVVGTTDANGNIVASITAAGVPTVLLTPGMTVSSPLVVSSPLTMSTPTAADFLANYNASVQGFQQIAADQQMLAAQKAALPADTQTMTDALANNVPSTDLVSPLTGPATPTQALGPGAPNTGNVGLLSDHTANLAMVTLLLSGLVALAARAMVSNKQ